MNLTWSFFSNLINSPFKFNSSFLTGDRFLYFRLLPTIGLSMPKNYLIFECIDLFDLGIDLFDLCMNWLALSLNWFIWSWNRFVWSWNWFVWSWNWFIWSWNWFFWSWNALYLFDLWMNWFVWSWNWFVWSWNELICLIFAWID